MIVICFRKSFIFFLPSHPSFYLYHLCLLSSLLYLLVCQNFLVPLCGLSLRSWQLLWCHEHTCWPEPCDENGGTSGIILRKHMQNHEFAWGIWWKEKDMFVVHQSKVGEDTASPPPTLLPHNLVVGSGLILSNAKKNNNKKNEKKNPLTCHSCMR